MIASTKQPQLLPANSNNSTAALHRNTNPANKLTPRLAQNTASSGGSVKRIPPDNNKHTGPVTTKATQSVPFLQRKFNIFGSSNSLSPSETISKGTPGNDAIKKNTSRSSFKADLKATTLPRNSAIRSSGTKQRNGKESTTAAPSCEPKGTTEKSAEISSSSDTFKGVQSLKQFWNSRISSTSGSKGGRQTGLLSKSKIRQDESSGESVNKRVTEVKQQQPQTKKVVSVTSNVRGKTSNDEIADEKQLNSGNCAVTLRQSASFAKSDNFDKYKTASTVKTHQLHRVSSNGLARHNSIRVSTRQQQTKRHTVDSAANICIPGTIPATSHHHQQPPQVVSTPPTAESTNPVGYNKSTSKFPQIATKAGGAKIHWPKREDILLLDKNRRKSLEVQSSTTVVTMIKDNENKDLLSSTKLLAKKPSVAVEQEIEAAEEQRIMDRSNIKEKIDLKRDSKNELEEQPVKAKDETMNTNDSLHSSRSATPSSLSLATTTTHTDSPRKATATRKASFKTRSGQSQSIRKLAVGSKVAALTHRFNQLIQTDATIMEEVKRKGVLVHRMNGHVYRIKEDTAAPIATASGEKKSLARTASSADSSPNKNGLKRKKSSVKKHDPLKRGTSNNSYSIASTNASPTQNIEKKGVKATIELFEPNSLAAPLMITTKKNFMKPKVPDKSEHVLRRTKELVGNRREVTAGKEEMPSRKSLRLDEIKEVTEEKALTPIREALPILPGSPEVTNPNDPSQESDKSTKKDKSVYGRIYEKLKINKASFLYQKKAPAIPSPATPTLQISNPVLRSSTYDLSEPVPLGSNSSIEMPSEQKIFEALETVDRKIENLHKSSIELSSPVDEDQSQNIQPNQSFLFRLTSAANRTPVSNKSPTHQSSFDLYSANSEPCAALNVSLIKSKTLSMDERNFPFIYCASSEEDHSDESVATSDLLTIPSPIDDGRGIVPELRTEYQEIINETDKLIQRMNETYGTDEDNDARKAVEGKEEEDAWSTQHNDETIKFAENNYDLYEQITSELEERGRDAGSIGQSHLPATATKTRNDEDDDEESIYQTVTEVKSAIRQAFVVDEISVNSYESCENYEAIDELRRTYREEQKRLNGGSSENGGYEICEPPEPPPPRKISLPNISATEVPQLPVPKRNKGPVAPLPKSTFYAPAPEEKLENEHLKRRKPQSDNATDIFHSDHVYEENIYDTIKSLDNTSLLSNNYESISLIRSQLNGNGTAIEGSKVGNGIGAGDGGDTVSNCYESLRGSTLTINHLSLNSSGNKFGKTDYYNAELNGLRHSESVSTLSSDHKTNSIYGTTLHYSGSLAMNPRDRHSIAGTSMAGSSPPCSDNEVYMKMKHPPSESYNSENSDEWVDISDGEEEGDAGGVADEGAAGAKHKLIIVRERVKNHRSTTSDWNAKIREQRIQQIQQSQYYDDDSDHHYESMYASNYENHSHQQHHGGGPAPQNLDIIPFDDDEFDSFDSDLDEDDVKKNDSGVDVSNTRLPDPPSSSNQVYALMQKFKTLSSLSEISKSLSRFATKKRSKQSSSPTVGDGLAGSCSTSNLYHNDPSKAKGTGVKYGKTNKSEAQSNSQFYANMDFHTTSTSPSNKDSPLASPALITSTPAQIKEGGISSPLSNSSFAEYTGSASHETPVPLARKKSKSGKSFKSKLRRSLVPDTSNLSAFSANPCNKSTFYVNGDSPDMDSGIFTGSDKTLKMEENNSSSSTATIGKENDSFTDLVNEIKTRNAKNNNNSQANSVDDVRRRSIATSRPLSPPPAPPVIMKENGSGGVGPRPQSKTSWYDECGVFKPDATKDLEKKAASMTNWYADSGLYQTSGDSVISSSGSSGVSTGGECNGQDDNSHSMFCNEPLYQIYSAAKLESITRDIEMETDGYEEIGKQSPEIEEERKKPLRPTALQLVSPHKGPSRTLWSEIPEVINSEILSTLTPTEKRVQEAKFEIITSEASYLKSLNLLKSHFMNHPAFRDVNVLSAADRKTLFSYTIPVLNCSEKMLTDLENCWQDNIMLIGLSHSILKHAECSFKVYVNYCEHQVRLDRILKKLKESNKKFCEILEQTELNPICCGLSFHSFLMLPMQRITRLPLLIDAVLSKLTADDDEYENWKVTLSMLNKIVSQCNEAAHKCEQVYEMQYISRQIEFPSDISPLPIVPMGIPAPNSKRRALVRKGELVHLIWRGDDGKLTFGKKFTKSAVYVFLFTDLLVLTKKKSDDTYLVFDYCCRSMLTVSSGDVIPQLPTKDVAMAGKHLILMTLLENHQGKTAELILGCESETDRTRWLKATEPPLSENPDETLYEQWDCPQVTVLHAYQSKQPDELNLDIGDVVNVTRKMADGWYHGERIRDGQQGWFPGNYTEEVASPHVRARNLKQRYRLLTFTANYLEAQKKK